MIRKGAIVCCALILFGCGGGGGDSNVTVTATAGVGGSINPAKQSLAVGENAIFTIQPDAIYDIQSVTGCGGSLSGNTYTATNVRSDCTVNASFKLKPLSMTVSDVPQIMSEWTVITVDIAVANIKNGINLSMIATNDNALNFTAISKTGNTRFTITPKDVDRDRPLTFNVRLQDGNDDSRVIEQTISLTLENTSFKEIYSEIAFVMSLQDRLVGLTEEKAVVATLAEMETLLRKPYGIQSNATATIANASVTIESGLSESDMEAAFNAVLLNEYESGNAGDNELIQSYNSLMSQLAIYNEPYIDYLNAAMTMFTSEGYPVPTLGGQIINQVNGTMSIFIGRDDLGQFEEDRWVFNEEYAYLAGLIATDCQP